MALSTKTIRRRIRSVKNTKKITKAMELVSASKMRRSISAVLMSRAYAGTAWEAVLNILGRLDSREHVFIKPRQRVAAQCFILISSNRGLCGGFNAQVISKAIKMADQSHAVKTDWVVMGKRGGEALARAKKNIVADFVKPDVVAGVADILPLARMLTEKFLDKTYDRVMVVYTDFVSSLVQRPRVKQLLPFEGTVDEELGRVTDHTKQALTVSAAAQQTVLLSKEYEFEPGPEIVLDYFLKRLIEIQLFQALLESSASEHAARMLAMKQANDAATDMIDDLTLIYNQARQAAITREIAEISSGKAALE